MCRSLILLNIKRGLCIKKHFRISTVPLESEPVEGFLTHVFLVMQQSCSAPIWLPRATCDYLNLEIQFLSGTNHHFKSSIAICGCWLSNCTRQIQKITYLCIRWNFLDLTYHYQLLNCAKTISGQLIIGPETFICSQPKQGKAFLLGNP